jgi:hypothetical protein
VKHVHCNNNMRKCFMGSEAESGGALLEIVCAKHQTLAPTGEDTKCWFCENEELKNLLRMVEWSGYDTEAGERACPVCECWEYHKVHGYACALGVALGSECEDGLPRDEVDWSKKKHDCSPETCGHQPATKHIDCPDEWHRLPSGQVYHTCPSCGAH